MELLSLGRRLFNVALAYACLMAVSASGQSSLSEIEIKAGFLYNFTKFVEWPAEAFADARAPVVLGVAGVNPFGNLLTSAAAGKSVNGRPVVVKQFAEEENPGACQILFISSSEKKRTAQILEKLKGTSVLTVGEGEDFTRAGGMIAFVIENDKVRLVINLAPALASRIKISAKVIAVGRLVGRQTTAQN
jgi:hypothetical protein